MLRSLSAAAVAACLVVPATASADWQPPRTLVPGDVGGADVAFGARGDLAVAYDLEPPSGAMVRSILHRSPSLAFRGFDTVEEAKVVGDGAGNIVQVAVVDGRVALSTRPPDGSFGSWTPMSPAGEEARTPQLAFSAGGAAILVWAVDQSLRARVRPAGGAWGPVTDLGLPDINPTVAVADDGQAIVTSVSLGQTAQRFYRTRAAGPNGAWGPPRQLGVGAGPAAIAMTPSGHVAALWREGDTFRLAQRQPGADAMPGASTVLTRPGVADDAPELLLWPDGQGVALLQQRAAGNVFHLDAMRFGPGWFSSPTPFAPSANMPQNPEAVLDRRGRAWVTWWETRGAVRSLLATRSPGTEPSLDLGTPTVLTAPGESINAHHAIDADGRGGAAIAWPSEAPDQGLRFVEWPGPPVERPQGGGGAPAPPAPTAPASPSAPAAPATPRATTPPSTRPKLTARGVAVARDRRSISFRLSAAARVKVTVARCAKRCKAIRTVTIRGKAGVNRIALGRRLAKGRYLVTVAPASRPKRPLVQTRLRVR